MVEEGRTFILLADGRRARGLIEKKRGAVLEEPPEWAMEISPDELFDPQDRAPRSFDRVGAGRHAMDGGLDPREIEERKFLTRVAARIADAAKARRFDYLVIAAPPRALGVLRESLPAQVMARVRHQTDKDIVSEGVDKVRARLKALRLG